MDNNNRQALLVKTLRVAAGLTELWESKNFQEHLLPYLRELSNIPIINTRDFTNDTDYLYALRIANIKAGAYKELLDFLESQPHRMQEITKQLKKLELESGNG